MDLLRHWADRPWAAYSVVFLPLFALEWRRAAGRRPRPAVGWALLAVALALELVLVAGGLTRTARAAVALAGIGLACLQGRPDLRAALLLIGFVPIPTLLVSAASPALERLWAAPAVELLQTLGGSALVTLRGDETLVDLARARLALGPADGGLPTAALLVGLAWYAGCRRGWSLASTVARALPCAALAVPLQILSIAIAARVAAAGGPARALLDVLPWLAAAAAGLAWIHRRGAPATPPPAEGLPSPAP